MGSVGRTVVTGPTVQEAAAKELSTVPRRPKERITSKEVFKPTNEKPKTQRLPRFLSTTNDYETTVTQTGSQTLVDLGPSDVTKAHITALEKAGFKRRGRADDTWYRSNR